MRLQGEGPPVFPTGEILLQPKEGNDIRGILNLIPGDYLSYEANKYNTYTIRIQDWQQVINLANKIYESGLVRYSHPNFIAAIEKQQVTPTDPLYAQQYYLNQGNNIDINAPQAWELSRGLNEVRVAVIDDGMEAHEDLNGRVLLGFTPTDPNGFGAPAAPTWPDDIFPFTPVGHGQACTGIIGATHDNVGVAGVFPCAQIIPVNIFNDWFIETAPNGFQSVRFNEDINDLRDAIDWAWDDGQADVLSNSWGFTNQGANFDAITFAIDRARTQGRGGLGSVVVFSSGNSNQQFNGVTFPANVEGVITVGAVNSNGNIWNYNSRGAEMDLVAPTGNTGNNGDVWTTDREGNNGYDPGNYVETFGGTSAAAPQVSGVAALMLSVNPNLTEAQVRTILQNMATDMGASGFDNTFGYGRLNAQAAVQAALPTLSGPSLVCTSNRTFTVQNVPPGVNVTWSVSPASLFAVNSGTGNSFATRATSSAISGQGTVTATLQGACGDIELTQNVWMGKPDWEDISVYEESGQPVCPNSSAQIHASLPSSQGSVSGYEWGFLVSNGITIQNGKYSNPLKIETPGPGLIILS